jgi:hypothetical protein
MKKRHSLLLGFAVLLIAAMFTLAGCDNPTDSTDLTGGETIRYKTVPWSSPNSSRAAGDSHYYLYYLGYIESVPIAYRTAYYYGGTTPITIGFEKNWLTEQTITESTTATQEKAIMRHFSGTVTVGFEAEAGMLLAKAKSSLQLSTTIGGEWSSSSSTATTLETATAKAEGESESITATIGEHGEAPGTYRYALFGVTDAYVLFQVNAATRAVENATFTTYARESSYAWGIDFDPSEIPEFGKTGGGEKLVIPEIDFTAVDAPTEELEGQLEPPPPPEPATISTAMTAFTGILKGNASKTGGDGDINSKNGRTTNWQLDVKSLTLKNPRSDGSYGSLEIAFSYTVREGQSDWTVLTLDTTYTVDLTSRKVISLYSAEQTISGSISGEQHDWVSATFSPNDVVRSLSLVIDGGGSDEKNIAFNAQLYLRFEEINPAYNP